MKRPSYRDACAWIAANDSAADGTDRDTIAAYVSSALVADMFGVTTARVAHDVCKVRERELAREARADRAAIARAESR